MGSGQKHRLLGSAPPPSSQGDAKQDQFDGPGERVNPFPQGLGFDPARDPNSLERKFNTRVELPCYRDNVSHDPIGPHDGDLCGATLVVSWLYFLIRRTTVRLATEGHQSFIHYNTIS
jgi:hypothetical protein